eukprot:SAG11_NODE_35775_length_265_cov_0.614458_1_plen_59_part_10
MGVADQKPLMAFDLTGGACDSLVALLELTQAAVPEKFPPAAAAHDGAELDDCPILETPE